MIAAGHGWGLAVFPLAAALVALAFGLRLGRSFLSKRRPHEGVWTAALFMYALASVAMFAGVVGGWGSQSYRAFWLFGAILNVPYLAQGEVYLLARGDRGRRIANGLMLVLVALSFVAAIVTWRAVVDAGALSNALPLGKDVWRHADTAYQLRWLSWIGYFGLLGGLLWSARQMRGRADLRNRVNGTIGIALGATLVAIGSGVGAGLHVVPLFSVSLAAGIVVMFGGFVAAGRPSHPSSTAAPKPGD